MAIPPSLVHFNQCSGVYPRVNAAQAKRQDEPNGACSACAGRARKLNDALCVAVWSPTPRVPGKMCPVGRIASVFDRIPISANLDRSEHFVYYTMNVIESH